MKYPLKLNTNLQLQDKDGEIVCGAFRDKLFGERVVSILNDIHVEGAIVPTAQGVSAPLPELVIQTANGNLKGGWTPERRALAAEKMRAISNARWAKRKAEGK